MKQPTQVLYTGGAIRFTTAISGSRTNLSDENSAATFAAAPEAMLTVSGMSRGAWQAPAT